MTTTANVGQGQNRGELSTLKEGIEQHIRNLAHEAPLSFLINKTQYDRDGRPVSVIGGLDDDLDGNIVYHMCQDIGLQGPWLKKALIQFIQTHNLNSSVISEISEILFQSTAFVEAKRAIIESGIEKYVREDYVGACHILIPQIEAGLREIVRSCGLPVLKSNNSSGMQYRTLDSLLSEEVIKDCFGAECVFYFRVMLCDQRGFNLRNDTCHGCLSANSFNEMTADRILHIILILSFARTQSSESDTERESIV